MQGSRKAKCPVSRIADGSPAASHRLTMISLVRIDGMSAPSEPQRFTASRAIAREPHSRARNEHCHSSMTTASAALDTARYRRPETCKHTHG